jgi:hypothetical protein
MWPRFENDWATADFVKQYLRNRRKYMARQSGKLLIARGHGKLAKALKARDMNVDKPQSDEGPDDEEEGPDDEESAGEDGYGDEDDADV